MNPKNNHSERIDKKLLEQAKELNWNDMNFPASWKDRPIDEFEKNNPTISVNVYEYEEEISKYSKN